MRHAPAAGGEATAHPRRETAGPDQHPRERATQGGVLPDVIRDVPPVGGARREYRGIAWPQPDSGLRITNPHPQIFNIFGITVGLQRLIVIIGAALLILLLHLFLKKTLVGTTIEAVAQNREGAMLNGINVNRVSAITFFISSATAAVAASFLSPIFMLSPAMGAILGMKAFIIVILGGMGSIPGAILGGYILGLIESLGGGYISAEYKDVFAFGALILILSIKPTGIFGKKEG